MRDVYQCKERKHVRASIDARNEAWRAEAYRGNFRAVKFTPTKARSGNKIGLSEIKFRDTTGIGDNNQLQVATLAHNQPPNQAPWPIIGLAKRP